MTLRPTLSIAVISVAILPPLVGCADPEDADPGGAGGSATGGMSPGSGGSGGACSGGLGTGGVGDGSVSSGGSAGGSSIPPTFETVKLVFQGGGPITTCSAAPCHGVNGVAPPGRPLELPLNDDQQLYTNLTTYISTACGNIKLVSPCDPAQSALPKILTGPCGMTPRMPYMCTEQDGNCIPDEYIAAITHWIANGAPKQ
jgi:hypothetical protein